MGWCSEPVQPAFPPVSSLACASRPVWPGRSFPPVLGGSPELPLMILCSVLRSLCRPALLTRWAIFLSFPP